MRPTRSPSPARPLFRLFLRLAVRGPVAHWQTVRQAPDSALRLAASSILFAIGGAATLLLWHRSNATLVLTLHAATMLVLPLYLAATAADLLSDRDETLALSHWPISGRAFYQAKFLVFAQLGAWTALALNLVGLLVGTCGTDGRPSFAAAHLLALSVETVFCLSSVYLAFQIRTRVRMRRGRFLAVAGGIALLLGLAFAGALHGEFHGVVARIAHGNPAGYLFPPAWFAGLDEALLRGGSVAARLGGWGVAVTALLFLVAWRGLLASAHPLSADALAGDEPARHRRSGLLESLHRSKIATLGLSLPAERAALTLGILYLVRSRDLKMRLLGDLSAVYLVPLLLLVATHGAGGFGSLTVAVVGAFLPLYAFLAVHCVEASNDWQAARIFQSAPLLGPAELCSGARRAVMLLCVVPTILFFAAMVLLLRGASALPLLLPGMILAPLVASLPNVSGRGVPLSVAPEAAKTPQGAISFLSVLLAMVLGSIATELQGRWYFWLFLGVELATVWGLCARVRVEIRARRW